MLGSKQGKLSFRWHRRSLFSLSKVKYGNVFLVDFSFCRPARLPDFDMIAFWGIESSRKLAIWN